MTCRPGHAPRHPDFAPGNVVALKHGATPTPRRAEQVAAEVEALAEEVAIRFPWTGAFDDERRTYARAMLDVRDIRLYLDRVGILDDDDRERPAVRTLDRCLAHVRHSRAALGLTPQAHASLLVKVSEVSRLHPDRPSLLGESLDALLAEGRAALERGAPEAHLPYV